MSILLVSGAAAAWSLSMTSGVGKVRECNATVEIVNQDPFGNAMSNTMKQYGIGYFPGNMENGSSYNFAVRVTAFRDTPQLCLKWYSGAVTAIGSGTNVGYEINLFQVNQTGSMSYGYQYGVDFDSAMAYGTVGNNCTYSNANAEILSFSLLAGEVRDFDFCIYLHEVKQIPYAFWVEPVQM